MKYYTVKASVSVDVEMSILAEDAPAARQIFKDQLMMTAALTEHDEDKYAPIEDSISDITDLHVEAS